MNQKNKPTKKTAHMVEKLHNIMDNLSYYCHGTTLWSELKKEAQEIEEHLIDLSIDKKVDHARLASKLKSLFMKENKELKKENSKLKKQKEQND